MNRNAYKSQSAPIFTERSHGNVRQDKDAPWRMGAASGEPSVLREPAHMYTPAPKRHGSRKRKTVEIGVCISPELKAKLDKLCTQGAPAGERLSISTVAAQFIEQGVRGHIDMQYGALLTPVIEQAIDKRLRAREARFAALLVRIAYESGQARSLLTNLLARSPNITPTLLRTILEQSDKRAKAKLTRFSPQITELIKIVESWMRDETAEGSALPSTKPGFPGWIGGWLPSSPHSPGKSGG